MNRLIEILSVREIRWIEMGYVTFRVCNSRGLYITYHRPIFYLAGILFILVLCDELITRPEESYRLWCVIVSDLETSRMRRP